MAQAVGQALLTCDAVARDPNGKITLYGIFDRIWAAQFPAVHSLLSVYWRCHVPGPGRVGVSILRPDGSTLVEFEPVETGKEGGQAMQGTCTLGGIEFPTDGEYALRMTYNGHEVMRGSLYLQKRG